MLFRRSTTLALSAAATVFFCASARAETDPKELLVFPETLPELMVVSLGKPQRIVRLDREPDAREPGVALTPAASSPVKCSIALMLYDIPGYARLVITISDDAAALAPATRLGQERLLKGMPSLMPGLPKSETKKIKIGADLDAYLTTGERQKPTLALVVPDKTGADRFTVMLSFKNGSGSAEPEQEKEVVAWLPRVAATIDVAKLQALPPR